MSGAPPSRRLARRIAMVLALVVISAGCRGAVKREIHPVTPEGLRAVEKSSTKHLKAHLKSGELLVFDEWSFTQGGIVGHGVRHSVDRSEQTRQAFREPFSNIALIETNEQRLPASAAIMAIVTGASLGLTTLCIVDPKACFGSCPTFYVAGADGELRLSAEGFSDAIAPSLEKSDVDALWGWKPAPDELRVVMRNEALETHVVRGVELLALPLGDVDEAVQMTTGEYRGVASLHAPTSCEAEQGDCTALVTSSDRQEWYSTSDGEDLGSREHIELRFEELPQGELALLLRFRQSLLTTFLFYTMLGYLGEQTGEVFAALERGVLPFDPLAEFNDAIGWIEVEAWDPTTSEWRAVGRTTEAGPLAKNTVALALPAWAGSRDVRVRLDVTRANWRFEQLAVAALGAPITPKVLRPVTAKTLAGEDVVGALHDPARTVVTMPGEEVELTFESPGAGPHAYLLRSRGYYIEWMRDEWVAEEDPVRAAIMMASPRRALRLLAPEFKERELQMEQVFWGSKYER